jgi:predicted XRE-type DNA-binding protein
MARIGTPVPAILKKGDWIKLKVDHAQLRKMLEEGQLMQVEIADRLGLTRERVRQLSNKWGFGTGQEQKAKRKFERILAEMEENRFYRRAVEEGFEVNWSPEGPKSFIVGTKLVRVRSAPNHFISGSYKVIVLRAPLRPADICAWKLPDGRFLIMPQELWPESQTCFRLEEPKTTKGRVLSNAHHYRDYIEAWHVLREEP